MTDKKCSGFAGARYRAPIIVYFARMTTSIRGIAQGAVVRPKWVTLNTNETTLGHH